MDDLRIGVVGSRNFSNYELLKNVLNKYLGKVWLIVSGGARGADRMGETWAKDNNIKTCIYYPDWQKHGKSAGFIRNRDIVENSDLIIAFWDGKSRGTKHSIDLANEMKKEVIIIKF